MRVHGVASAAATEPNAAAVQLVTAHVTGARRSKNVCRRRRPVNEYRCRFTRLSASGSTVGRMFSLLMPPRSQRRGDRRCVGPSHSRKTSIHWIVCRERGRARMAASGIDKDPQLGLGYPSSEAH